MLWETHHTESGFVVRILDAEQVLSQQEKQGENFCANLLNGGRASVGGRPYSPSSLGGSTPRVFELLLRYRATPFTGDSSLSLTCTLAHDSLTSSSSLARPGLPRKPPHGLGVCHTLDFQTWSRLASHTQSVVTPAGKMRTFWALLKEKENGGKYMRDVIILPNMKQ